MKLRPYQQQAYDAIIDGFDRYLKQLLVFATGSGKTIVFSSIAEHFSKNKNSKVLILADTDELIEQAVEKLFKANGIYAAVEKGSQKASLSAMVVVSSIQTMQRRLEKWPASHFGLVIADEAHLSLSPGWQKVLNHFNGAGAKILGVTATPGRADNRPLMKFYENIPCKINLFELIRMAYLVPIKVMTVPLKIDLSKVECKKGAKGDLEEHQLSDALNPYFDSIIEAIKEHAGDRQVLVFLPLKKTSQAFADRCIYHGLTARHVDGESKDRKATIQGHKERRFQILCNVMVLTKGYDDPNIGCVINLRVTRHPTLYQQIIGRGTRPFEGCIQGLDDLPAEARHAAIAASPKPNLLILDFLWQFDAYAVMTPANLMAKTEDEAKEVNRRLAMSGPSGEPKDLLETESDYLAAQEEALLEKLKKNSRRRKDGFDALEWAGLLRNQYLQNFTPTEEWEADPATEKQLRYLKYEGIDPATVGSKGYATRLIGTIKQREKKGKASVKQLAELLRFDVPDAHKLTKARATTILAKFMESAKVREAMGGLKPSIHAEPAKTTQAAPTRNFTPQLPRQAAPTTHFHKDVIYSPEEMELIQGNLL